MRMRVFAKSMAVVRVLCNRLYNPVVGDGIKVFGGLKGVSDIGVKIKSSSNRL